MSTFHAVNTGLGHETLSRSGGETTPTTPRPDTAPDVHPKPHVRLDDATTPTRATFGALAQNKPLPASSFTSDVSMPESVESEKNLPTQEDPQPLPAAREPEDVEMDDSDDGQEASDGEESINADGTRSTKKKKSQKFWCTEYPPCNLSFTRSEHLARHIRKHTGERPFQCHCSRRFSRLDNLRQHAQTVHANEEIPTDSLAATGTRFQRQVRTDRVRPPVNRSRASTAGSQSSQGRGHTRNSLSASSIGSVASTYSQRDDGRRRPPPLVMAADPRGRVPQDGYSGAPESPGQYQSYRGQSPGGYSTPTSATYSTGQNSPRWGSGMQSPISSHSRTASIYAGHRTPGRRLSVPSGANPFQSPHGGSYGPPPLTPQNPSNNGVFSPAGSIMASPTTSNSGFSWSRRDSGSSMADEAWRRRTWHPETYSHFTSRLVNVTTPNYYPPAPAPQNSQTTRLPGIESFDPLPRPATPPRMPSPMMIDTPSRAPAPAGEQLSRPDDRKNPAPWDMGLHRNLTRLDIAQGTPPSDAASAWASEANRAVQAQAEQARTPPTVRFEQLTYPPARPHSNSYQSHQHRISAPPITPREAKRHGWYHGPVVVQQDARRQRTSPEDSSSSEGGVPGTPGSISVGDYHPSIVHSSGWVEPSQQRPAQTNSYSNYVPNHPNGSYAYAPESQSMHSHPMHEEPKPGSMLRLEALVAVATSEENATTAY